MNVSLEDENNISIISSIPSQSHESSYSHIHNIQIPRTSKQRSGVLLHDDGVSVYVEGNDYENEFFTGITMIVYIVVATITFFTLV